MRTHSNKLFETGNTIIPKTMKHLGLSTEFKKYKIFYCWEEIVGKDLAKNIIPQEIKFSVLYVYTYSSVWANSFQYLKMDIIAKINKFVQYNLIKDIQFTRFRRKEIDTSPIIKQKVNLAKYINKVPINDVDINNIKAKLINVKNKDLQLKLQEVCTKSLQLQKLKQQYGWNACSRCGRLKPPQDKFCDSCTRELKQEKEQQIIDILLEVPWGKYPEIAKYVDCTLPMVNKVRMKLVQSLASRLKPNVDYKENYYSMQAKTVAMIYKSIPPDKLNDNILKEIFKQLRFDTAWWNKSK